jgi:hypothetical protein
LFKAKDKVVSSNRSRQKKKLLYKYLSQMMSMSNPSCVQIS